MRYTLLMHYPEMSADELGPEALAEGMRAFDEYAKALDAARVLQSAEVLQPVAATTTISLATGELVVQDGPFADSREQLGGTVVIHVADLDAAPGVFVDARRMRLALTNLLDNAIKFGTEGSKVTVQAFSLGDGGAELVVTDQGIGIPEDRLTAVTAPFVQVDGSSRRAHDGLGLGLAVADRVMRDHGGTVALDSRVGEGTTVRLRFPRERVAWPTAVVTSMARTNTRSDEEAG